MLVTLFVSAALALGQYAANQAYDFYSDYRRLEQQQRQANRLTTREQVEAQYAAGLRRDGVAGEEIERRMTLLKNSRPELENDFWNRFFTEGKANYNRAPNNLLVETVEHRKPGAALDYGMGDGRNALYLAKLGWQVAGFDPAVAAVRVAQARAKELGLHLDTATVPDTEYDFGHERFDLILASWMTLSPGCPRKVVDALKPGGLFVLEGSASWFPRNALLKSMDDLVVVRYEIVNARSDFFNRTEMEVVRMVARKPIAGPSSGKRETP